jgi:hypothetical protein
MKKVLLLAVLIPVVVVAWASAWFLITRYVVPAAPVMTHDEVIDRIENVAKLITVQYYMTDIVDYANPKMWPFSDQKVLVIANARVYGGLDLSKPSFAVTIQEAEKRMLIRLPRPRIIALDPTYRYYDIQGAPSPEAHTYIINEARFNLRSKALQAGILEDTRKSARAQLAQLYPDYQISVTFEDDGIAPDNTDTLHLN